MFNHYRRVTYPTKKLRESPETIPGLIPRSEAKTSSPYGEQDRESNRRYTSPAENFQKSIKRDPSHYLELKAERQWDLWIGHTRAIASNHGISEVLNTDYLPVELDDVSLFQKKNTFMFTVLQEKLKTDQGKFLVREYITTCDAQSLLQDLILHHATSTMSGI
jgi:hypothetical protein